MLTMTTTLLAGLWSSTPAPIPTPAWSRKRPPGELYGLAPKPTTGAWPVAWLTSHGPYLHASSRIIRRVARGQNSQADRSPYP